jgi:hypothetical protein
MSTNEQNAVAIRPLIPTDYNTAMQMADVMVKSGVMPQSIKTKEAVFVAMQMGAGLGLTPMQSVQSIAVINGKPALYGDAMLAIVRSSGLLESIKEEIVGEGDKMTAQCTIKRKGEDSLIVGEWSVKDADNAGKWGKQGPWKDYPKRMLKLRARSFALRDAFPDLLLGLQHTVEELKDSVIIDVTPTYNHTASDILEDDIPEYKPTPVDGFVSLSGGESSSGVTLKKDQVLGYLKDKIEAIETLEELAVYKDWSRANYPAIKTVIVPKSADDKIWKDLFFDKERSLEKTNSTENSNLDL